MDRQRATKGTREDHMTGRGGNRTSRESESESERALGDHGILPPKECRRKRGWIGLIRSGKGDGLVCFMYSSRATAGPVAKGHLGIGADI